MIETKVESASTEAEEADLASETETDSESEVTIPCHSRAHELESLVSLKERIVRKYKKSFMKMAESKSESDVKSHFDKFRSRIVQDILESSTQEQKEALRA